MSSSSSSNRSNPGEEKEERGESWGRHTGLAIGKPNHHDDTDDIHDDSGEDDGDDVSDDVSDDDNDDDSDDDNDVALRVSTMPIMGYCGSMIIELVDQADQDYDSQWER